MRKIGLALVLFSLVATASADRDYYLGLDMGYSNTHYNSTQLGGDNGTTGLGYRFTGGFELNQNVSLESGYTHFAKADGDAVTAATDHAYDFSVVGRYPLGSGGLSLFGKLGVAYMRAQKDFSSEGHSYANKIRPAYGFGISEVFTPQISFNMQLWRVQGKNDAFNGINVDTKLPDADLYSVGVIYRFI